jgi:predicted nucleic acid-binding protein
MQLALLAAKLSLESFVMPGKIPVYYWDTCLFLAWIKDEQRKSGEMAGVFEVIDRVKRRDAKIVTSTITQIEVLSSHIPVGMDTLMKGLMKRIDEISVDIKVAGLAHNIRDHYAKLGGKTLSTPDAIHVATAILYRVDEFHTFDNDGTSKSLGLLPLSGNVGGNKLIVCKPEAKQPQLDLRKQPGQ